MIRKRPALFRGRHFEDAIILLCVRWYLRYSLTYRDLEEIMAERGLSVDHVTIWRWVQRYAPVLNQRVRRELRCPNRSWRVDETYIKVAGNWTYLYRAVDSAGETIEFMLSPKRDLAQFGIDSGGRVRRTGGRRMQDDRRLRGNACDPQRPDPLGPEDRFGRPARIHSQHLRHRCVVLAGEKIVPIARPSPRVCNTTFYRTQFRFWGVDNCGRMAAFGYL